MNGNYAHPKQNQSPSESHCQNALLYAHATEIVTPIFSAIKAKTFDLEFQDLSENGWRRV